MELEGGEVIWSWQSCSLSQNAWNIPSVHVNQQLFGKRHSVRRVKKVSAHQANRDRCRMCVCLCVSVSPVKTQSVQEGRQPLHDEQDGHGEDGKGGEDY